jgi:hypothetical protein
MRSQNRSTLLIKKVKLDLFWPENRVLLAPCCVAATPQLGLNVG